MIKLFVFENGGSNEDAKDIFYDSLLTLLEITNESRFALECKFSTFIFSICKNKWYSRLSRVRSLSNYLRRRIDDDNSLEFLDDIDIEKCNTLFWESFEKLPEMCKAILRCFFKEIPAQEIAKIFGISYGNYRKRKSECQKKLISTVCNHPEYNPVDFTEISFKN